MARFERRGFGGRRFGPRPFERRDDVPKPINVGEEYDVEISEVGSKGDGIARIKNFVVFVNGGKQGEKTRIKIKEVRNRFAIGEKVGSESASSEKAVEVTEEKVKETQSEEEESEEEVEEESEEQ